MELTCLLNSLARTLLQTDSKWLRLRLESESQQKATTSCWQVQVAEVQRLEPELASAQEAPMERVERQQQPPLVSRWRELAEVM